RIIESQIDNIEALSNLGDALRKVGQLDEANIYLKKALTINPNYINAINSLGIVLQQQGDFDAAESRFRYALSIQSQNLQILSNLAGVLHKQDRYGESIILLEKVIELKPDFLPAWANLSAAYTMTYDYQKAELCALKAIQLDPNSTTAWTNLGKLYYELGKFDESKNCFDKSLSIEPHNPDAIWNKSFTSLITGNLEQGWKEYEEGLATGDRHHHCIDAPLWQGESLDNKKIIVLAEQGLGDELMFASCINDLKQHSSNISYECDKRLLPLFQRSFPDLQFIAKDNSVINKKLSTEKQYDYYIPAGSLPLHFRKKTEDFPQRTKFLIPDENKTAYWRSQYSELGEGIKIGISWQGGKRVDPVKRSIALDDWLPILKTPNCVFMDIQYGDTREARNIFEKKHGINIHCFAQCNPLEEQDDFASQLTALDLVISVSNATVHLAGALGQTTWALIPYVPSWRWGFSGKNTHWYRSVELYRQTRHGGWPEVISILSSDLNKLASNVK
ncbi:MAG: tetratricopeptide repeat protein, partial [Gammaproteobacteria bacterium]|nr:tetratricopeptide repeat protein [Gammaproteobacteria bacterium]